MSQGTAHSFVESSIALDDNPLVDRETPPVVLVVDDSATRQSLVKFLQMRQYSVVAVDSGADGIAALKTHRPAAAIVDLNLRNGSGREVVAALPITTAVIIVATARTSTDDFDSRPATRVVAKPYSLMMLMDTLQDLLEPGSGGGSHAAAS